MLLISTTTGGRQQDRHVLLSVSLWSSQICFQHCRLLKVKSSTTLLYPISYICAITWTDTRILILLGTKPYQDTRYCNEPADVLAKAALHKTKQFYYIPYTLFKYNISCKVNGTCMFEVQPTIKRSRCHSNRIQKRGCCLMYTVSFDWKCPILQFVQLQSWFNVKITPGMNSSYIRTNKAMYYTFDISIFTFDGIGDKAAILYFSLPRIFTPTHLAQAVLLGIVCVFT